MVGTFTHGLLKQREKMAEGLKTLARKHPQAYNDIKDIFLGEGSVESSMNDLLHYACAKRSEIISLRRKGFRAKNSYISSRLDEIPPSEAHLFEQKKLAELIHQQGGVHKVFAARKPCTSRFKSKPGPSGSQT